MLPPSAKVILGDRRAVALLVAFVAVVVVILKRRGSSSSSRRGNGAASPISPSGSPRFDAKAQTAAKKKKSIRVDGVFLQRLRALLKICFPSWVSKEGTNLLALTFLLALRTRLTVIIAQVVGENAKKLVHRDFRGFVSGVIDLGLWALPSSVVNSGIKYTTSILEQQFRSNLLRYMHNAYMTNHTVYKVCAHHRHQEDTEAPAGGQKDKKEVVAAAVDCAGTQQVKPSVTIDNPDHRLTEDIKAFADEVTGIFPETFKPTIDIMIFMYELSKNGGLLPPLLLMGYYFLSGAVLKTVMPNFAKLTALTQHREGDLRAIHTQLGQHAEEVAFYRGERIERENANRSLDSLVKHSLTFKKAKAFTDFVDAILIKYGATCAGYSVCAIGIFEAKGKVSTPELTRIYIRSSQLYIPLAKAVGKIVMLHKKITALAGYTSRVAELHEVFEHVRQMKIESKSKINEVKRCTEISFRDVDVIAPSGVALLKDVNFSIRRNQHLLIMGNNGSGKSALMRCIAGLWPIPRGEITRPPMEDLGFLPQRTYLPTGNFRSQLIFPDTEADMKRKGISDDELLSMAYSLGLKNVIDREGGLDAEKEWHEVYSGGERQRVAFVRILYHRPQFALLDESSSAVSAEIEPSLYLEVKARGTTLITVSHRDTLKQYHDKVLTLDGVGGYTLTDTQ